MEKLLEMIWQGLQRYEPKQSRRILGEGRKAFVKYSCHKVQRICW